MYVESLKISEGTVSEDDVLRSLRETADEFKELLKGIGSETVHAFGGGGFNIPFKLFLLCKEELKLKRLPLP